MSSRVKVAPRQPPPVRLPKQPPPVRRSKQPPPVRKSATYSSNSSTGTEKRSNIGRTKVRQGSGVQRNKNYQNIAPRDVIVPDECLLRIFSYLDGEELGQAAQTCQWFHSVIISPKSIGMLNPNRTIRITCTRGSWKKFFETMKTVHYKQKTRPLSRFSRLKVVADLDNFKKLKLRGDDRHDDDHEDPTTKGEEGARRNAILGIRSIEILDVSASTEHDQDDNNNALSGGLFQKRRSSTRVDEVDQAKVIASRPVLRRLSLICPNATVIAWDHQRYALSILGDSLRDHANLKEMHLDDSIFYADWGSHRDTNSSPPYCIFQDCKQNLQRVSILNCQIQNFQWTGRPVASKLMACSPAEPISQEALMKFVRETPSLRWFQSDLTSHNIRLLKQERPEVTFV